MQTNNAMIHKKFKKIKWYFNKMIIIPEEWNVFIINNICTLNAGGTPSRSKNEYWDNGDIPWLSSGEIDNNLITTTNEKISKLGLKNSATKLFPKKTVLIAITGFGTTRGKTSLLKIESATNQSIVGITIKKKILDEEYLWRYVQSQYYLLRNFAQGTQQPGLNLDIIKKFKIIMPTNILEQQKIASILSRVDALIETTQECIEKTQKLKNGLLQTLFKKGVNHKKFKKVKTMFGKYELIPEEWTINKLDKISKKIIDGTHFTPNYINKGIPFLRVVDIQKFPLNWNTIKKISYQEHHELIKRCKPEKNDILYSKNGTIGIPRLVDWNEEFSCFVSLCLIKLKQNVMHSDFLVYFLLTNFIKKQISSKTKQLGVANLHLEEIREFRILTPPLIEQQKIASILSEVDAFDKYVNQIIDIFMLKNLLLNYDIIQQTKLSIFINAYTKILILYKNNIG